MKFFKKTLIAILTLLMLTSLAVAVGCDNTQNPPAPSGYSVTFMVEDQQYGETLTVQRGRRITAPADPTFTTAGYVFTGWYTDENFAEGTKWNFTTGIVTSDVTLYAGYRVVTAYVSDVAKAEEPVTSKLVWTQSAASDASNYEVILTSKSGSITLTGSVSYDAENTKVTFTPNTIPQGGVYTVSVRDNSKAEPACVVEDVLFCGEGTQANPYLIGSALDFNAVNRANVSANTYFQLAKNITIETSREAQKDYVFNGTLMGSGRTITLANSNSGAIYNLGAQGYVYNVNVAGSVSTALYDSVGAIVDFNAGRIEKVNTTANVESTAGLAGSNGLASALDATLADGAGSRGIAGGLVGTNLSTGVVYNCKISTSSSSTGTVKAAIAGGTIVGLNAGKIEMCVSNGCLGAWNSKETGKSTSNYSYGGGIAGINAGQILKCSVSGSGKIMAQRFTEDSQAAAAAGTNNANIGGIVGYNMKDATVSECYFAGVRVHGDENVGGIAGLNAGTISDVYVEGVNQSTNILVYIGGRTNIGGIVGKSESTGSVVNAFVTANVFAYGANGVAYAVSEKANNSVYLSANPNTASSNDGNANPTPANLTTPIGENNVAVETIGGSFDGSTNNVVLAETYLATVNGNTKFNFNGTTIKLNFESEVLPEATMEVALYSDGAKWSDATVAETGKTISGPTKKGFKFIGWAVEANGEIVFPAGTAISLYDLQDYADASGKAELHAIFEEREVTEGLIVGIYYRYVDKLVEGAAADIEAQFLAWMSNNGYDYEVEFRVYEGSSLSVADFGAAINNDGDVDVILGAGSNISSTGGVAYIAREYMTYEGLEARYAVLLTDTDRALDFYAFVTGLSNKSAEITFDVDGQTTTETVNLLLGTTVTVPTVTVADGYELKGWATTQGATEAQVTGSVIGYKAVENLLTDGKVTLYPVIAEAQVDLVVYIHLSASSSVYITGEEADAIESAIATLLPGKVVKFVRVEGKNAAGFAETVLSNNVDLYIGGNNAGDVVFDDTYGKTAAGEGHFENTSRKVGIVANSANKEDAIVIYNYLTQAKA